jgi:transposase
MPFPGSPRRKNAETAAKMQMQRIGAHPKSQTVKLGTNFSEWSPAMRKANRVFTWEFVWRQLLLPGVLIVANQEFRVEVAKRIVQGESVSKLHQELQIKRSVLYRWRGLYRKEGAAGLDRAIGRPPGVPNPTIQKPGGSVEEALRRQVAELERKIGQQILQLDFFKRAFKRVKESRPNNGSTGATASTKKSGQ